jgi:hypothetical protein
MSVWVYGWSSQKMYLPAISDRAISFATLVVHFSIVWIFYSCTTSQCRWNCYQSELLQRTFCRISRTGHQRSRKCNLQRLRETWKTSNAEMSNKDIDTVLCAGCECFNKETSPKSSSETWLSTRAYYRTLKLARTIADLAVKSDNIASEHITEALGYREKTK